VMKAGPKPCTGRTASVVICTDTRAVRNCTEYASRVPPLRGRQQAFACSNLQFGKHMISEHHLAGHSCNSARQVGLNESTIAIVNLFFFPGKIPSTGALPSRSNKVSETPLTARKLKKRTAPL